MIGLVSPKIGLIMLSKLISSTLKQNIENFDILCDMKKTQVIIKVYQFKNSKGFFEESKKFILDEEEGSKLLSAIDMIVAKQIKDVIKPDYISVNARLNGKSSAGIYYTENGNQTTKAIEL